MTEQIESGTPDQLDDGKWTPDYFTARKYLHGYDQDKVYDIVKFALVNIQTVEEYDEKSNPFEWFDDEVHNDHIQKSKKNFEEEELKFMIDVAEHVNRPSDMLMFLGEYFKENIKLQDSVKKSYSGNNAKKDFDKYYISSDILNSLGTACKKFIENHRQQLRISIAISRKPIFHEHERKEEETDEDFASRTENLETPQMGEIRNNI